MFLFAYIQRDPDRMQHDAAHRAQVFQALDGFMANNHEQIEHAKSCSQSLADCDRDYSKLRVECGKSSTFATFFRPAPYMANPKLDNLAPSTPRIYPLVCKGGEDLSFSYEASSDLSTKPHVQIQFKKAPWGVGHNGERLWNLKPGECAWVNRSIRDSEPDALLFKYPVLPPSAFSIQWTPAGAMTLKHAPGYLHALKSSQRYPQSFLAYNDGAGHLVVTKWGVALGGLDVQSENPYLVGPEKLDGLRPGARVYTDREYTYSAVPNHLRTFTYLMTACDDKFRSGMDDFMSFVIGRGCNVHVAYDDRYPTRPRWLRDFQDTGHDLVFRDGRRDVRLSLLAKYFPAGKVVLGSNLDRGEQTNAGMYTVVLDTRGP
jgi:hypothetical protein